MLYWLKQSIVEKKFILFSCLGTSEPSILLGDPRIINLHRNWLSQCLLVFCSYLIYHKIRGESIYSFHYFTWVKYLSLEDAWLILFDNAFNWKTEWRSRTNQDSQVISTKWTWNNCTARIGLLEISQNYYNFFLKARYWENL